jgi:CopG family nickel-responsive transcriptional regulator
MQRVTITLDDDLMAEIDRFVTARGYQGRSEAIRDLARAALADASEAEDAKGDCVAALVYVYDHAARDLASRLTESYHHHHDLALATLHVHLDESNCLEVTAMRGPNAEVRHFAEHVIAERGVRYGKVVTIPTKPGKPHAHGKHRHPHG